MKHSLCLAMLAASMTVVGCSSNAKKPVANSSVTDIRSTTPPPPPPPMVQPVQPIQPVQPVQPVIADTAPVAVASATPAITGTSYTIQKGDTLFKIARARYGDAAAVRKIKEANPSLDPNHIKVGQKINLP
jgi:5'-nucleotidase/UDP-sugar diphosphatase